MSRTSTLERGRELARIGAERGAELAKGGAHLAREMGTKAIEPIKERRRERRRRERRRRMLRAGSVGFVGMLVGLIIAPRSGRDTRAWIGQRAKGVVGRVRSNGYGHGNGSSGYAGSADSISENLPEGRLST